MHQHHEKITVKKFQALAESEQYAGLQALIKPSAVDKPFNNSINKFPRQSIKPAWEKRNVSRESKRLQATSKSLKQLNTSLIATRRGMDHSCSLKVCNLETGNDVNDFVSTFDKKSSTSDAVLCVMTQRVTPTAAVCSHSY